MSNVDSPTTGDLQTALKNAVELLNRDPALAQEQAAEILKIDRKTLRNKLKQFEIGEDG